MGLIRSISAVSNFFASSSYIADFSETTITFEQGVFQTGMTYTIKNDQLIMINPNNDKEIIYEIEKAENEIHLIPANENYGTLILVETE